jgi:predicted RNA binding protein YcfA (HicA-like mRNA interferase family)
MNGYYALIIEALRKQGFSLVRPGKGSHEIWGKGSTTTTVPFNCPSRHTANAIMRQAGIDHKF